MIKEYKIFVDGRERSDFIRARFNLNLGKDFDVRLTMFGPEYIIEDIKLNSSNNSQAVEFHLKEKNLSENKF